ncbi:MAG TPA: acetolactate synthase small subunit [Alphaproteobacteria bacterium]|nr:acetolactate synthase small subunit [Alphaproteobacteria bacterium]
MMDGSVYESAPVEAPKRNCLAVLVDNEPGVLARVIGLFSGRGYNIESLTVDEVDSESHLSRITIVTSGPPMMIEQIKAQLSRLVPVRQVVNLTTQGKSVEGCLAYVKFIGDANKREDAKLIARKLGARTVDMTANAVIFELTAMFGHIDQMIAELKPLGQVEVARTGSVAMLCGDTVLSITPQAVRKSA